MNLFLRKSNKVICLLCCIYFYQASLSHAQEEELSSGLVPIGDSIAVGISSQDYVTDIVPEVEELQDGSYRKTYTISHPGASYISVHFANFDLAPSCTMEINDGIGEQSVIMRGRGRQQLGKFWGHHVEGEMMKLELFCPKKYTEADFYIDEYVAGFPIEDRRNLLRGEHFIPRDLSICSSDNKKNAICYKDSHPEEYQKARAVVRLIINGRYGCTGFLVGDSNMLLTNEHCIDSNEKVQNTDFEFMMESTSCEGTSYAGSTMQTFDGVSLLKKSYSKDYALIQLAGNPLSTYGSLELENRLPAASEVIYIPQHAGVRDKELGIFDPSADDPRGRCNVLSTSSRNCGRGARFYDVSYSCDTEGGSSGSPVISAVTGKVIALHHCGGGCSGNLGVPMSQIYDEISDLVYPQNNAPTVAPSPVPTFVPTLASTSAPSISEDASASASPVASTSTSASSSPSTASPTSVPTSSPISVPTLAPTNRPTPPPALDACLRRARTCPCQTTQKKYRNCVSKRFRKRQFRNCDINQVVAAIGCFPKPICKNDPAWRFSVGKRKVGCNFVARNPRKRCNRMGRDGRRAHAACKKTCSSACN